MEEQVQQIAEKVLPNIDKLANALLIYLQSGVQLAQEQAPLLIQEILKWGLVSNILTCIISLPVIILCTYTMKKIIKKYKAYEYSEDTTFGGLVLSGGINIGTVAIFINSLFIITKILVAPRLYLIDYLKDLIG